MIDFISRKQKEILNKRMKIKPSAKSALQKTKKAEMKTINVNMVHCLTQSLKTRASRFSVL